LLRLFDATFIYWLQKIIPVGWKAIKNHLPLLATGYVTGSNFLRLIHRMENQKDAYYINLVLAGNTGAYKYLIEKYQHMAFTLAYRVVNNGGEAEEVCQDAFLKAYKSLGSLRNPSHFSTWLYSIVYHSAISAVRKRKLQFVSIDQKGNLNLSELPDDDQEASEEISRERLDMALQKLDETDRAIVSLYYLENCDVRTLCQVTGLSPSNVKIRLFRARKKLYEILNCCLNETGMFHQKHEKHE
jgi:RNA polymerase sigma-70 factor (ECF subfamily)